MREGSMGDTERRGMNEREAHKRGSEMTEIPDVGCYLWQGTTSSGVLRVCKTCPLPHCREDYFHGKLRKEVGRRRKERSMLG